MKVISGALVFAAAMLLGPANSADAAFSDQLCPEAAHYVNELGKMTRNDPPQKQYEAFHAVTNAYSTCASRKLTDAKIEPDLHYAYIRQASFGIAEARALLALGRAADAKRETENSKRLAQDVFDWRQSISQNGAIIASSGSDKRPSVYQEAAKEVIAAANEMLAQLASPAATPSPAASPTSGH